MMKNIEYKTLWRVTFYVYNSIFWIIAATYCVVIQSNRSDSLKSIPIIGAVLLISIISVFQTTTIAWLSQLLLKRIENLQPKKFMICCLFLTFWYLPLTIPGTLHVIIEDGSFANILGSLTIGMIFYLIPSICYLNKLKQLYHSSAINSRINYLTPETWKKKLKEKNK